MKLKVGDKVLVKDQYDEGCSSDDYPYVFVEEMLHDFGGKIVTITRIEPESAPGYYKRFVTANTEEDAADIHIKEDHGMYHWAQPMFKCINGFDEI